MIGSPEHEPRTDRLTPNEFGPDTRDNFHVLKHDNLFAVFSGTGCMNGPETGSGELHCKDGLFADDMRALSRLVLSLNRCTLTGLGAETSEDTAVFRASLSNTRLVDARGRVVPPYSIHVDRVRFLSDSLYDRIRVSNYHHEDVELDLVLDCWADFRDIFEVRGIERAARGRLLPPVTMPNGLVFGYRALDGRRYATEVRVGEEIHASGGRIHFRMKLAPKDVSEIDCVIRHEHVPESAALGAFEAAPKARGAARAALAERHAAMQERFARVTSSRPAFDEWIVRSVSDIAMLTSQVETGPYPFAGTPWFSAPFGRDAIIAALETLWVDPSIAAGVLDFLAATQATREDEAQVASPGKIIHEMRRGEMARLGEVPYGRYYGGVDQSLLFVVLAERYYRRTGDLATLTRLKPAIDAALGWAEGAGDPDRDGLIEYDSGLATGLRNQGWKDSDDAVFHADGSLCEGLIALVEVQAYHVAALRAAAAIEEVLGDARASRALHARAATLQARVDTLFWDDDLSGWVLALDGEKRPARIATSNAAHVLFAEATSRDRAERFARGLDGGALLSDWGLRTVSQDAARFNPMGYHTGSIWPHDNAIAAAGLASYGQKEKVLQIFDALFQAARQFPARRLPELYCGFSRDTNPSVVAYPSACSPQIWAAGAPFLCLSAVLGLDIDVPKRTISLSNPDLPLGIDRLDIDGLRVDGSIVDLRFVRDSGGDTHLEVRRAPGHLHFALLIGEPPASV